MRYIKKVIMLFRTSLLVCLLFLLASCSKDNDPNEIQEQSLIPTCVDTMPFIGSVTMIHVQEISGENHYWLNTGANAHDGDEYIVNESCDTVCRYAGWFPADCIEDYDRESWVQVWP